MKQTTISIETARAMYEQGGTAKEFALEHFTEELLNSKKNMYPDTWNQCLDFNEKFFVTNDGNITIKPMGMPRMSYENCVNTKEQAEAILALTQLLICRDAYRNGWKPELSQERQISRASLIIEYGEWSHASYWSQAEIFSFEKKEQAIAFIENFRHLLEQVKPLFL
jgi:hypothetical protein